MNYNPWFDPSQCELAVIPYASEQTQQKILESFKRIDDEDAQEEIRVLVANYRKLIIEFNEEQNRMMEDDIARFNEREYVCIDDPHADKMVDIDI